MKGTKKVIDLSSNDKLEQKTDDFKSSNSLENYHVNDVLSCILEELQLIKRELKKINK